MKFTVSNVSDVASQKINWLIYGEPKVGKTTLISTLPISDESRVLVVSVDPGLYSIRNKKFKCIHPEGKATWTIAAFDALYLYILSNQNLWDWVVIDGLDDVGIVVLNERKAANANPMKAYDEMNSFMDTWIKKIRDIPGMNTLFITHMAEKEDPVYGSAMYPAIPGKKFPKELTKYFDVIGCMRYIKGESGVERKIQMTMDADPRYECGDRTGSLLPLEDANIAHMMAKISSTIPGSAAVEVQNRKSLIVALKKMGTESDQVKNIIIEELRKYGTNKKMSDLPAEELEKVLNTIKATLEN